MKHHLDPNKVAVWGLEFRFSTKAMPYVRGIHFAQALDNEQADQLYDRLFDEVDAEIRAEYGDYQLRGCNIEPAIMKDD